MESRFDARYDPNPQRVKPSTFQVISTVFNVLIRLPIIISGVFLRRLFSNTTVSLGQDIYRTIFRSVSTLIPLPVLTAVVSADGLPSKVCASNRFSKYKDELFKEIQTPDVAGYWICQGPPGQMIHPSKCDIVIFYCHPGGYTIGHPCQDSVILLRIAEVAQSKGVTVAIFTVNYTLAPTGKYPKQRDQAVAAYRHLLDEVNISAAKIVCMGVSSGAHLVLDVLSVRHSQSLPVPGGAYLICPWIDVTTKAGSSLQTNRDKCILNIPNLHRQAELLLGNLDKDEREKYAETIDFTLPRTTTAAASWKDILPSITLVAVGGDDIFEDMGRIFVKNAISDGAQVYMHIEPGECHFWQKSKDASDIEKYLRLDPGQDVSKLLPGTDDLVTGFMAVVKDVQSAEYYSG